MAIVTAMVSGCAIADGDAPPAPPPPLEAIWSQAIRAGDVVVVIPGTGVKDYVAAEVEAIGGPHPRVDVRDLERVRVYATAFEQALAATERAGLTHAEIEHGAVTFLLWGAGLTTVTDFDYVSFDGVTMRIDVLGGENACAVGGIVDNYFNYSASSADADARDLYTRVGAWLSAHPTSSGRNISIMAHSWGGAVAEYLALEMEQLAAELGPLPDDARVPLTVAAGVPRFVLGYDFVGPRSIDLERPTGDRMIYEIDRPDDPVHHLRFDGNFDGHHYEIVIGEDYRGFWGITTDELSCGGVAGACE